MAQILLGYRQDYYNNECVPTYSLSFHRELKNLGHTVMPLGEGHKHKILDEIPQLNAFDLFIDLDCGRNTDGNLSFHCYEKKKLPVITAARFQDTHGYSSLHRRLAKNYDHVFFAVWDKRDLFTNHKSAHWCPSASDDFYFDYKDHIDIKKPKFHAGFFGSKNGLDRADILKEVCERRDFSFDVREIGKTHKIRWPRTAQAMYNCRVLFNKGQKHDGPNQRVIESMLMNRPLLSNRDSRDGMKNLFEEGEHFLGWDSASELGNNLDWCLHYTNKDLSESMAARAYIEVKSKHLIKHRVKQILEVCI